MRILIRFEDAYGCASLFRECNKALKGVTIEDDISEGGVFKIAKSTIGDFDYVIAVTDLDDSVNFSMTGQALRHKLEANITKDNKIKNAYIDKVIPIPVFICYETLYLYAETARNIIKDIDLYGNTASVKLIKEYKKYFDYSLLNPEYTTGLADRLQDIKTSMYSVTEQLKKKGITTQRFHQTYSKQILKIMFADLIESKRLDENVLDKCEDIFFEILDTFGRKDKLINEIVSGMSIMAEHNKRFLRLLNCKEIIELNDFILTEDRLEQLCTELDDYNRRMKQNFGFDE